MAKIITISTGKGGSGKSTTAWNIGAGLKNKGYSVLLVDLDQQHHLSKWLGYDENPAQLTLINLISDVAMNRPNIIEEDYIQKSVNEELDYIPSNSFLVTGISYLQADNQNKKKENKKEFTLLSDIFKREYFQLNYDYIIIDCPASFDELVTSAYVCCDSILIPTQAEIPSYNSISDVLSKFMMARNQSVEEIENNIEGILILQYFNYQGNTISKQVYVKAKEDFDNLVYDTPIPHTQQIKKSVTLQKSVVATNTDAGVAYRKVVNAIIERSERIC